MAAAEKLKERLGKAGFLSAGMVELEAGEDEGDDV